MYVYIYTYTHIHFLIYSKTNDISSKSLTHWWDCRTRSSCQHWERQKKI